MPYVFCNSMTVPLRFYLHQDDEKASSAAPGIVKQITEGGGALVSSIDDAQCVIIVESKEENAMKLHKTLAGLERNVPVLRSDWVRASARRGSMLGPKEKPEWGGFLLKYYHDAYEFFEDELEPANIKEEDSKCEPELIDLTELSDDDAEEKPLEQFPAEPTITEQNRPRRLPGLQRRKAKAREDPRTAAQILHAISEDLAKYKIGDLVLMVNELKDKAPWDYPRTCELEALAMKYRAAGKDYGVAGHHWVKLFDRNRPSYEACIKKLREGDESLDEFTKKDSSSGRAHSEDPLLIPVVSPAESSSEPKSSKSGGVVALAPTPTAFPGPSVVTGAPSTSYSLSYRSLVGLNGPSRPEKRTFSAVQVASDSAYEQGPEQPSKRIRQ